MYSPKHYSMKIASQVVVATTLLWIECMARSEPLSQLRDFEVQVQHLLSQEMMTADELARVAESVKDLKKTLSRRWEGVQLYPYGSITTGLALKTSDLDVHVMIPSYNHTLQEYFVQETAKIFYQDPRKYSNIESIARPDLSRVSYYNIPLRLKVDMTMNAHDGVEVTNIIKYFINLDERYIPLIMMIKIWSRLHQLTGKSMFSNFAFYMMTIFYLQQKQMAPTVYQMQEGAPPHIVNEWNVNFKEIPFHVKNTNSLYDLLGGFFKYYSEFEFENYCMSVYVGRPVRRADLEHVDTVPDELVMYKNCLRTGTCKPLDVHTAVCIQNVFKHDYNSATSLNNETFLKFIHHLKIDGKLLEGAEPSISWINYLTEK